MNTNTPYLLVSGGMAVVGVIAIVVITSLRPDQDNAVLIATILGLLASTTASILAFQKASSTHIAVNSRLGEFIAAAKAQGKSEGIEEGRDAADARTDLLNEPAGNSRASAPVVVKKFKKY